MSWQRLLQSGLGSVRFRLAVQAHPDEFVSHESMEIEADPATNVRRRLALLQSRAFKLSERVSLVDAELDSSGFTAEIVDVRKQATASFYTAPTLKTLLQADLAYDATTITVLSTAGWPTSGWLWLDAEVIYYTGTTSTSFTGCVRAQLGTIARAHYYDPASASAREPEITNLPVTMEGRRATLYAYGDGDDPQGEGTQIWRGVVATQPRYNGTRYSILIDPITRVLKQTIGGFLDSPMVPRGIYYSPENPLYMHIEELNTDTAGSSVVTAEAKFALSGFFEDDYPVAGLDAQGNFIKKLQDEIDPRWGDAGGTSTIKVDRYRDSWCVRFTPDSSTPRMVVMGSALDPAPVVGSYTDGGFTELPVDEVTGETKGSGAGTGDPIVGGRTYRYNLRSPATGGPVGAGTVPRGTWGAPDSTHHRLRELVDLLPVEDRLGYGTGLKARRLYIDAPFVEGFRQVVAKFTANGVGEEGELNESVSVDETDRFVERPGGTTPPFFVFTSANLPELQFLRTSTVGSLPEFIEALIEDSREYCNLGVSVDLEPGDFDIPAMAELAEMGARGFLRRKYAFFASQELEDVLTEEAKLYGAYPYITAEGKISFRMLRHAMQVEHPDAFIDAPRHSVGSDWLSYERQPLGVYNTVVIKTGYDPIEDEHTGREWVVRDVRAYGRSPIARTLEIAPLSQSATARTYEEILSIVQRIFGLFAGEYSVLQLDVTPHLFPVRLGDVVAVTSGKVPNEQGTLGIDEKRGIVISREWRLREDGGSGTLQILMTGLPFAGYSPACPIESATLVTGTTYDLKLHANRADYFPHGTTHADFFQVGDLIRVLDWNPVATSIGAVKGTITGIDPATDVHIVVELESNPTFGTNEQYIAFRKPSAIEIEHPEGARVQHAYGAIADSDGIIRWNGFETGFRVFAP